MDYLYSLFNVDTTSMLVIMAWGNLVSVILIVSYRVSYRRGQDPDLSLYYVSAKLLQSLSFFLIFGRNALPLTLSVNLGNTLLLGGFCMEAMSMLRLVQNSDRRSRILVAVIAGLAAVVFNAVEFLRPDPPVRVITASICAMAILAMPSAKLLFSRGLSRFKRTVGVFYFFFLALLLPRAVYAMFHDIGILSNVFAQNLSFLSMFFLMIYSLSAYLLLMKENADKIISVMASTDPLTGLSNRYSFLSSGAVVFERCRGENVNLAIFFADIDNFKKVNDTYGHHFGDAVLVRLGQVISCNLRAEDRSCRYGGEEFVAVLPGADFDTARKAAERIMEGVAQSRFEERPDFSFTLSVGLYAGVPGAGDSLMSFIDRADQGMYRAKNNGKNRVELYRPLEAGAGGPDAPGASEPRA